jgi:hypothetical protein
MKAFRIALYGLLTFLLANKSQGEDAGVATGRQISAAQINRLIQRLGTHEKGKVIILCWPQGGPPPSYSPPPPDLPVPPELKASAEELQRSMRAPKPADEGYLGLQLRQILKRSGFDVTLSGMSGSTPVGIGVFSRTDAEMPICKIIGDSLVSSKIRNVHVTKGAFSGSPITIIIGIDWAPGDTN